MLGVLLFHAHHLRGGFLGVDLFFTLSGFLITSLLVVEWRERGTIQLSAFWTRRARRLLPALFLLLVSIVFYAVTVARPNELPRLRADAMAALFYVANWWQIAHRQSYWDIFTAARPLAHMWSLAIEEQFYVVWPLVFVAVVRCAGRRAVAWLAGVTAALTAASAAIMVWLHHAGSDATRLYEGSDTRAASILVGAMAAMLVARPRVVGARGRPFLEVLGCCAAAGLAWSWFTIDGLRSDDLFRGGLLLHSLASAVLIAAAAEPLSPLLGRILAVAPLRLLGMISYGVYLFHLPVFVALTPERVHIGGWMLDGMRLAVTLAVATLSFRLVERPIRRGALGPRGALVGLAASVTLIVLAITIATAPRTSVARARTPTVTHVAASNGQAPRRVMVIGDSVSRTVGAGLDAIKDDRNIEVQNSGMWGCGLSRADRDVRLRDGEILTERLACPAWPKIWRMDASAFNPDDIVLILGAWDLADRKRNGEWTHPCAPGFDEWWKGELHTAFQVLREIGARFYVTSIPLLRSDILGVSQAETDRRVDCLNGDIRIVAAVDEVDVIDLAGWVCPDRVCVTTVGGIVLRPDGVHYDDPGGPVVAAWLLDELASRHPD